MKGLQAGSVTVLMMSSFFASVVDVIPFGQRGGFDLDFLWGWLQKSVYIKSMLQPNPMQGIH